MWAPNSAMASWHTMASLPLHALIHDIISAPIMGVGCMAAEPSGGGTDSRDAAVLWCEKKYMSIEWTLQELAAYNGGLGGGRKVCRVGTCSALPA